MNVIHKINTIWFWICCIGFVVMIVFLPFDWTMDLNLMEDYILHRLILTNVFIVGVLTSGYVKYKIWHERTVKKTVEVK